MSCPSPIQLAFETKEGKGEGGRLKMSPRLVFEAREGMGMGDD